MHLVNSQSSGHAANEYLYEKLCGGEEKLNKNVIFKTHNLVQFHDTHSCRIYHVCSYTRNQIEAQLPEIKILMFTFFRCQII